MFQCPETPWFKLANSSHDFLLIKPTTYHRQLSLSVLTFGLSLQSQPFDHTYRNITMSKPIYSSLLIFECSQGKSGNSEGSKLMTLICLGVSLSCFIMVSMLFLLIQQNIIPRWDRFLTFLFYSPNLGPSNIFIL